MSLGNFIEKSLVLGLLDETTNIFQSDETRAIDVELTGKASAYLRFTLNSGL